jgi:LysM repeat protein
MNSVRPLVTITILVVVGAYLYVKINQGPARPHAASDAWQSEATEGVPPLETAAGGQTAANEAAPPWPTAGQAAAVATPAETVSDPVVTVPAAVAASEASPNAELAPQTLPAVPTIPALPDVSTPENATGSAPTASVPPPVDLPANIPTARYPDQPGPAATEFSPTAAALATNDQFSIPAATNAQSPPEQNPLRQANQPTTTQPTANADPYSNVYGQTPAAPQSSAPVEPTFAASWPEIQAALDQGKLSRAHELLSKWYGDPSLTPAEAEQVETLLGQLAGTVVYSTEHRLEPARIAKPGETLEAIANEYNVPWQLLAKINGIPAPDRLQAGQELKVVRGPFSAVIDLDRKQLTLMLGDRYAGAFQVTMPEGSAVNEGQWIVQGKPEAGGQTSVYGTASTTAAPAARSRQLLLTSAGSTGADSANPLIIGSRPRSNPDFQRVSSGGQIATSAVPYITVSPTDVEELADILSVGSPVVIRR